MDILKFKALHKRHWVFRSRVFLFCVFFLKTYSETMAITKREKKKSKKEKRPRDRQID